MTAAELFPRILFALRRVGEHEVAAWALRRRAELEPLVQAALDERAAAQARKAVQAGGDPKAQAWPGGVIPADVDPFPESRQTITPEWKASMGAELRGAATAPASPLPASIVPGQVYLLPATMLPDDSHRPRQWRRIVEVLPDGRIVQEVMQEDGELQRYPALRFDREEWAGAHPVESFPAGPVGVALPRVTDDPKKEGGILKRVLQHLAPGVEWAVRRGRGTAWAWFDVSARPVTPKAEGAVKALGIPHLGRSGHTSQEGHRIVIPVEMLHVARREASRIEAKAPGPAVPETPRSPRDVAAGVMGAGLLYFERRGWTLRQATPEEAAGPPSASPMLGPMPGGKVQQILRAGVALDPPGDVWTLGPDAFRALAGRDARHGGLRQISYTDATGYGLPEAREQGYLFFAVGDTAVPGHVLAVPLEDAEDFQADPQRFFVAQAIAEGRDVPVEVQRAFPDLVQASKEIHGDAGSPAAWRREIEAAALQVVADHYEAVPKGQQGRTLAQVAPQTLEEALQVDVPAAARAWEAIEAAASEGSGTPRKNPAPRGRGQDKHHRPFWEYRRAVELAVSPEARAWMEEHPVQVSDLLSRIVYEWSAPEGYPPLPRRGDTYGMDEMGTVAMAMDEGYPPIRDVLALARKADADLGIDVNGRRESGRANLGNVGAEGRRDAIAHVIGGTFYGLVHDAVGGLQGNIQPGVRSVFFPGSVSLYTRVPPTRENLGAWLTWRASSLVQHFTEQIRGTLEAWPKLQAAGEDPDKVERLLGIEKGAIWLHYRHHRGPYQGQGWRDSAKWGSLPARDAHGRSVAAPSLRAYLQAWSDHERKRQEDQEAWNTEMRQEEAQIRSALAGLTRFTHQALQAALPQGFTLARTSDRGRARGALTRYEISTGRRSFQGPWAESLNLSIEAGAKHAGAALAQGLQDRHPPRPPPDTLPVPEGYTFARLGQQSAALQEMVRWVVGFGVHRGDTASVAAPRVIAVGIDRDGADRILYEVELTSYSSSQPRPFRLVAWRTAGDDRSLNLSEDSALVRQGQAQVDRPPWSRAQLLDPQDVRAVWDQIVGLRAASAQPVAAPASSPSAELRAQAAAVAEAAVRGPGFTRHTQQRMQALEAAAEREARREARQAAASSVQAPGSRVTLAYTADEGITVAGDTRPVKEILKAQGLRWWQDGRRWYVPRSRGQGRRPRFDFDGLVQALQAAGAEVALGGDLVEAPPAP